MNKRDARGILLDLLIPVCVLSVFAVLALFQQIGYQSTAVAGVEDTLIDQDAWESLQEDTNKHVKWSIDRKALILVDEKDKESLQTQEQISYVLASMGVESVRHSIRIAPERNFIRNIKISSILPENCTDVIICFSSLVSSGIDITDLTSWVASGGKLMLAAGLETEELFDYIQPEQSWLTLLGINNIMSDEDVPVDSMMLTTTILAGGQGMEFSDDVIFCNAVNVELLPDCETHIVTADDYHRPLLWERDYKNGHILVCNADLMDGKTNRGMIATCFARMDDVLVYPVINASVYCIDDFPSVAPAGFDANVLSQYGYTVEDFYANVWWPSMQRISEENEIRYSTFLIECYDAEVQGPFNNRNNQPWAAYYTKQLLEIGGELGLHGYNHQPLVLEGFVFDEKNDGYKCWITVENMLESVREALNYASTLGKNIDIRAYVAPSNVLGKEAMDAMIRQFEDIRVYAGVYIGTQDQLVQEFAVINNAVVQVPRLTADMQMESSEWWLQVNELNYHYYESNYIHPDDILDEERSDGGDFSAMLSSYENMVRWNKQYALRTTTITEAAGAVQRYCNLSVSQSVDDTGVGIHLNGLIDEAYLMLRTKRNPIGISTGELMKIDDGCYIIRTQEADMRVEFD